MDKIIIIIKIWLLFWMKILLIAQAIVVHSFDSASQWINTTKTSWVILWVVLFIRWITVAGYLERPVHLYPRNRRGKRFCFQAALRRWIETGFLPRWIWLVWFLKASTSFLKSFTSSRSFLVASQKSQLSASLGARLITGLQWHAAGELSYSSAKETNTTARIRKYGLQFAIVLLDQGWE